MGKQPLQMPEYETTPRRQKRLEMVNTGIKVLNPSGKEFEEVKEDFGSRKRLPYAGMRAHQELAAQALAVGGNTTMAATYAGISRRQLRKYLTDPDFRARVEELRTLLLSKVRGKIIKEIDRRTSPELIKKMELLDLLRVGDRVGLGRGAVEAETPSGTPSYDSLLTQIFVTHSERESTDFQVYEPEKLPLPGSDSQFDE